LKLLNLGEQILVMVSVMLLLAKLLCVNFSGGRRCLCGGGGGG
jgi:hypothetical protein